MKLKIKLFATLKDHAGQDTIQITISDPATVKSLLTAVAEAYPALQPSLSTTLVSVNKAFAFPETEIHDGDEIALLDVRDGAVCGPDGC